MKDNSRLLTRSVTNIIPGKKELAEKLAGGKKLNIYHGIDPTATRIHIGHAVPLRKLQEFVELGHNVTFLIGDFTALIGDTSDKDGERPVLTYKQITENFKTYKEQAGKIVDFSRVKVRFNSEWLKKLGFADVIKLTQHFSVGDFVSRELIRKRLDSGTRVGLHEFLYPVMQGYDSYFLDTDIQIGGADQTFNMQAGRTLLKDLKDKESFVVVTGYLEGTDGRKMSKSWGNAIWINDDPGEMFGKVMSLRDELIVQYFTNATKSSEEEIKAIEKRLKDGDNPLDLKKELGIKLVTEFHSHKDAENAKSDFENTFQKGQASFDTVIPLKENLLATIAPFTALKSVSDAKRMISQKAIEINGQTITDSKHKLSKGDKIKIGKRIFGTVN